jgi:hypothetical protein
MSLNSILRRIPPYVPDLRKNFEDLCLNFRGDQLTIEQFSSVTLAVSYCLKNELLVNNFKYEARMYLEESNIVDIRASVVMMTRNNIFYRHIKASSQKEIREADIALLETTLSNINIDKITHIMCLLAISSLNGSQFCAQHFTDELLKRSVSSDSILAVVRIVAVLKAVAEVLEIEAIRNYEFVPRGENI